jgi:hypothetical protein
MIALPVYLSAILVLSACMILIAVVIPLLVLPPNLSVWSVFLMNTAMDMMLRMKKHPIIVDRIISAVVLVFWM